MSVGYNDLNDLIQNQRALAELVNQINTDYETTRDEIEFIKGLNLSMNTLETTLKDTLDTFKSNVNEAYQDVASYQSGALQAIKDLKAEYEEIREIIVEGADGSISVQDLISHINSVYVLVDKGVYDKDTDTWSGGLRDLMKRVETLEEKSPPLVIMDEVDGWLNTESGEYYIQNAAPAGGQVTYNHCNSRGETIEICDDDVVNELIASGRVITAKVTKVTPIEDRVAGVLYGRKTNVVTDIEAGQVIRISPYLQGVVVK